MANTNLGFTRRPDTGIPRIEGARVTVEDFSDMTGTDTLSKLVLSNNLNLLRDAVQNLSTRVEHIIAAVSEYET